MTGVVQPGAMSCHEIAVNSLNSVSTTFLPCPNTHGKLEACEMVKVHLLGSVCCMLIHTFGKDLLELIWLLFMQINCYFEGFNMLKKP